VDERVGDEDVGEQSPARGKRVQRGAEVGVPERGGGAQEDDEHDPVHPDGGAEHPPERARRGGWRR
jgi:hypothetical protein